MSWKYSSLSFLLFFVVLLLGLKNYEVWTQPIKWVGIPENDVAKMGKKTEIPHAMEAQQEPASIQSYILMAGKNIFYPERKEFPLVPSGTEAAKSTMRPQILLYGVTISGGYESALIVNPGRPLKKGEREMMTLKIGENIGEYRVAKILPDRIIMEKAEDSFEVLLYDPKVPKRGSDIKPEINPATVKPSLSTPTPAPRPAQVPGNEKITETLPPKPVVPAPIPFSYGEGEIVPKMPLSPGPPTTRRPTGPSDLTAPPRSSLPRPP